MEAPELLPRKEINADVFTETDGKSDGSGILIAIWDTGVDPSAAGLQVTSDGKPKIVDLIDASGSGDVKMRAKIRVSKTERTVKTLTGRQVIIPDHWEPVNGIIRMGVKLASELFPHQLLQRLRSETKEDVWLPCVKQLAANIAGDIAEAEEQLLESTEARSPTLSGEKTPDSKLTQHLQWQPSTHQQQQRINCHEGNLDASVDDGLESLSSDPGRESTRMQKSTVKAKGEHNEGVQASPTLSKNQLRSAARLLEDALCSLARHYSPLEMVYDCFVFHNGSHWLSCVDTSPYNPGKTLADMPLLADYTVNGQYACFGVDTQLYFSVKILNEGRVLQIVTNDSGHGTHVAAMAAAYFPPKSSSSRLSRMSRGTAESDTPQRNGVAPGAQIVSIKISDSRLGSMETGISLLRAIRWTVELKCDVVNYSFGEHCVWPNVGRLSKHLNELVHAHGVVMVASGGNNGPGLGTVGSPGASVDGLIGVAPIVFPDMMRGLYSQPLDPRLDPTPFIGDSIDRGSRSADSVNGSRSMQSAAPAAYTWGSRGPALDGSLGLCVAAPGAANTSVASWQLRPSALLNGSSMSAPLVTGCVALLLSGVRHCWEDSTRQTPLRVPPTLLRMAIMNTATTVPHLSLLDQGHGVIQVDKAFRYLVDALSDACDIPGSVAADDGPPNRPVDPANPAQRSRELSATRAARSASQSPNHFSPDALLHSLTIPPDPFTVSAMFGWRVQCTVTGPGCVYRDRGIWLRRGVLPRTHIAHSVGRTTSAPALLPVLRYTVHIAIHFDKSVPLEVRRTLELHLNTSVCTFSTTGSDLQSSDVKPVDKPNWLQIAPMVSVTSLGRDVSLVIDPNQFAACAGVLPGSRKSVVLDTSSQSRSSGSLEQQAISPEGGSFCWPSNLSSPQLAPMPSTEPRFTLVSFCDSARPELGALAHVPITIHSPLQTGLLYATDQPRFTFSDTFDTLHKVRRWFVEVPTGATAGVLRLARLDDNDLACEFKVTVCLPQPRSGLTTSQQEITWPLTSLNRCGRSCSTIGRTRSTGGRRLADDFDGATQLAFAINWESDYLELTIAQHWGLEQPATVIGELYFRGLEPSVRQLSMNSSDHYTRVVLRSNFTTEEISPSVNLTHWALPLRPSESKIVYLGHGQDESLINQRGCYALRLIYQFSCPFKSSTINFELPWLQELLYDSDYLVQLYHLYDWRGRFLGAGDYDLKRQKRQKFSFPLEKGDYKVIVQICHEQGGSLGSSHMQPGDLSRDGAQHNQTGLNASVSGGDTTAAAPLERLRHHPAVVRFRLPGPNAEASSGGRVSGGSAGHPVTFEFAAFAFSLGLNGSKPCSALDAIPHGRSKQAIAGSRVGGGLSCTDSAKMQDEEQEHSVETTEEGAVRRGELNRRCPCLPTSLGASESTSVFIGLCDERYPSYVVRGSYFSGSISYYNSDVLQGVVTYPFRLVVDTDSQAAPAGCTHVKKDALPDGDRNLGLAVGNYGLSSEDFAWLEPLTDCVRLSLSRLAPCPVNASDTGPAQGSKSTTLTAATPIPDTQAQIHSGLIPLPSSFEDDGCPDQTSLLYEASDLESVQTPSVVEQLKVPVPTPSVVQAERMTSQANETAEQSLCDDSTSETLQTQTSVPSQLLSNSLSETNNLNQTVCIPDEPSANVNDIGSPRPRRSLKINNEVAPPPVQPAPSLSMQLASVHEQLVQMDIPCRSTCADWSSVDVLRAQRADLWSRADQLILGRSLDDVSTDDVLSSPSLQQGRPSSDVGSFSDANFFQHLLTMRLVSSSSQSGAADKVSKARVPKDVVSSTESKTLPCHADSDANLAIPELSPTRGSTLSPALKRTSAPDSCLRESTGSKTVKPKVKGDGPVHNYLELKLRLVDTLARYGRLLCERILLARFTSPARRSSQLPEAGAYTAVSRSALPAREPNDSCWTISQWLVRTLASLHIDQSEQQQTRKANMVDEEEIRKYLRQIHSRLLQLTTSTTVSTNSVGERVEIGAHALPSWLLASGVQELRTNLPDGTKSPEHSCAHPAPTASWSCGTVGGRLLLFYLLYNLVEERFAQAVRLLTRLVYQIEEPPAAALHGLIPCGSTPSIGHLRPVHATLAASLATAKLSHPWLLWSLRRIGWTEVAGYLEQQAPILFPEYDYSLMADLH